MKLVKISELFDATYGNKLDLNKMKRIADGVNFIGRTAKKNGVVAMVEPLPDHTPYQPGAITVALGGSVLSCFVQIRHFYTAQNVAVLISKESMSIPEKLYYACAISFNRFRYSTCGREANRTFKNILVPARTEIPEWVAKINTRAFEGAELPVSPSKNLKLDTSTWRFFKISDLFDIRKGKRLTKAEMIPGNVPFIGAIDSNNGLTAFIGQEAIHEGGTITVNYNGNGVAEAYYQSSPFWATDDINVLYPKFELTPSIAMFISTIIRQEKYRFNYGRKWHLERMKGSTISLPATDNGSPDWDYMENYVNALPFSSQIS